MDPHKPSKKVRVDWCKEMLENTMAVPQKQFIGWAKKLETFQWKCQIAFGNTKNMPGHKRSTLVKESKMKRIQFFEELNMYWKEKSKMEKIKSLENIHFL